MYEIVSSLSTCGDLEAKGVVALVFRQAVPTIS